ncbi:MAG: 3'-5' exonuclease [Planctomycetaceae bacterium]
MAKSDVSYLVFDIETIADGELISRVKYPLDDLSPADATARFRAEQLEKNGTDILPPTYMLPISVVVGKVGPDFRLIDLVALDEPQFRPWVITKGFWNGWRHYQRPTFVTFNGRGYDMPIMELAAYRYGLAVPDWFDPTGPSYQQRRNRYNSESHFDLLDFFTNFGAMRLSGGLNLMANLIGKPGKTNIDGSQVQDLYDSGKVREVNDYCRCDVLDTYFVFLRSRVILGLLSLEQEQLIVEETKQWLTTRAGECSAYEHYLTHWGDWQAPPEA